MLLLALSGLSTVNAPPLQWSSLPRFEHKLFKLQLC